MLSWPLIYLILFAESLAVTLLLVPLALRVGKRWRLLDEPDPTRKVHTEVKARSGGLAMLGGFLVVVLGNLVAAITLSDQLPLIGDQVKRLVENVPDVAMQALALLAGTIIAAGIGLLDDRRPLPPGVKLIGQVIAALLLLPVGIHIRLLGFPEWVGMLVTVLWVVGLTNAFNFLDNMDGLSTGVAAICAGVLIWALHTSGERFTCALLAVFLGCLLAFLRSNWFPAKLFMGDGGSHFIGYFLASISVLGTYYAPGGDAASLAVLVPIVVFGLPLFDMVSVILIRLSQGRSPFQADTQHFSHRLVALGMRPHRAVLTIYLLTLAIGLSGLALLHLPRGAAVTHLLAIAMIFVVIYLLEHVGRNTKEGK